MIPFSSPLACMFRLFKTLPVLAIGASFSQNLATSSVPSRINCHCIEILDFTTLYIHVAVCTAALPLTTVSTHDTCTAL